ncbi:hypothetical protein R1sor_019168 [Riccia sorocarpa]|uniref:Fcf2 pre-rRNA processing C-terminal domain-containing protein n=1 Tax=Riccia sorocarpa TaxID=122646 RepID=A0ABD3ICV7_9MARC
MAPGAVDARGSEGRGAEDVGKKRKMEVENISWAPDTGLQIPKLNQSGKGKAINITTAASSSSKGSSLWAKDKELVDGLYVPPLDLKKQSKLRKKTVKDTAGPKWFDMPAVTLTPELKREVELLKMRSVLDPKRHYKANDSKSIPKYFQIGTVVAGAADFYSGRLTKKERKMSFADELLNDTSLKAYTKRKYGEIQEKKQDGGKRFWKKKVEKRKPSEGKELCCSLKLSIDPEKIID